MLQPNELNEVMEQTQKVIDSAPAQGKDAREFVVEVLTSDTNRGMAELFFHILQDPNVAVNMLMLTNKAVGATNEVLKKNGIEPVHISELKCPAYEALEETLDMTIDQIIEECERQDRERGNLH